MRRKSPFFACEIYNMENDAMLSRSSVLTFLLAIACAASPAKVTRPWRVEFLTSGGLSGRGVGNVTLDSDGKLEITTITRKACSYEVSDAAVDEIEALLAESRPHKWGSYVPESRCCDRVEYSLVYADSRGENRAVWIDNPLPLPEDVVKLSKAMAALRNKYSAECLEQ